MNRREPALTSLRTFSYQSNDILCYQSGGTVALVAPLVLAVPVGLVVLAVVLVVLLQ